MKIFRKVCLLFLCLPSLLLAVGSVTGTVKHKKAVIEGASVTLLAKDLRKL